MSSDVTRMRRRHSPTWATTVTMLMVLAISAASLSAKESRITAEQAKRLAVAEAKKLRLKPELFRVAVDVKPLDYQSLLKWTRNSAAFRTDEFRRMLARRHFWVVRFEIPGEADGDTLIGGGGSWIFVDANSGDIIYVKHWK